MEKRAIITGVAGGLGQALAKAFEQDGYRIIGTDRTKPHDFVDAFVEIDLARLCRDPAYRDASLAALAAELEGRALQALVNNAALQTERPSEELTAQDWRDTLDVNVVAPFLLAQGLLPSLEAAPGVVINVSALPAVLSASGQVCYAASKAALEGLTRALAVDLGRRVRVNALRPSAVTTPMTEVAFAGRGDARSALERAHPLRRLADPEEVARAALFLASDDASFITGEVLRVDGGLGVRAAPGPASPA